jgi:hypothetical protein
MGYAVIHMLKMIREKVNGSNNDLLFIAGVSLFGCGIRRICSDIDAIGKNKMQINLPFFDYLSIKDMNEKQLERWNYISPNILTDETLHYYFLGFKMILPNLELLRKSGRDIGKTFGDYYAFNQFYGSHVFKITMPKEYKYHSNDGYPVSKQFMIGNVCASAEHMNGVMGIEKTVDGLSQYERYGMKEKEIRKLF